MISPDSTGAGFKVRDFCMTNVVSRDYPRNSLLGLLRTLIFQHSQEISHVWWTKGSCCIGIVLDLWHRWRRLLRLHSVCSIQPCISYYCYSP